MTLISNFQFESDSQVESESQNEVLYQFKNHSVKELYDVLHTSQVADLQTTEQITEKIFPYVQAIVADENAYDEANEYKCFYPIVTHINHNRKTFVQLDMNSSLCFELWCYVYH